MKTHPDPEQLSAYVDGQLTDTERDDLEQHLTSCSECSASLRALRATLADMRALSSPAPSEQESWALRAAIAKARKRPAERYRRWVVAASGIAAAAIAFGIFSVTTSGRKNQSETHPRTLAGAVAGTAAIQIDPTNYTSASATTLLTSFQGKDVPAFAAASPAAGLSGGTEATSSRGGRTTATDAQRSAYLSQITRCQSEILAKDTSGARARAYIVGRYDGTPAFFLVYAVGTGKSEMWVVQQKDCYIRLFLAPR
jgi:hypothetical protein